MELKRGVIIVMSGFSGAGKGTVIKKLVSSYDNYIVSVSMTTRAPREGEVDGVDYFFTDVASFDRLIAENGLIEHARYVDNYYGTPRKFVEDRLAEGKDVLLEIEIRGALQIKAKYPDAILLFITPPSIEELKRRLTSRGTETEEVIAKRLRRAQEEAEVINTYDYIVVNDDLDTCVRDVHALIASAKSSTSRNAAFIESLRSELTKYA